MMQQLLIYWRRVGEFATTNVWQRLPTSSSALGVITARSNGLKGKPGILFLIFVADNA